MNENLFCKNIHDNQWIKNNLLDKPAAILAMNICFQIKSITVLHLKEQLTSKPLRYKALVNGSKIKVEIDPAGPNRLSKCHFAHYYNIRPSQPLVLRTVYATFSWVFLSWWRMAGSGYWSTQPLVTAGTWIVRPTCDEWLFCALTNSRACVIFCQWGTARLSLHRIDATWLRLWTFMLSVDGC